MGNAQDRPVERNPPPGSAGCAALARSIASWRCVRAGLTAVTVAAIAAAGRTRADEPRVFADPLSFVAGLRGAF